MKSLTKLWLSLAVVSHLCGGGGNTILTTTGKIRAGSINIADLNNPKAYDSTESLITYPYPNERGTHNTGITFVNNDLRRYTDIDYSSADAVLINNKILNFNYNPSNNVISLSATTQDDILNKLMIKMIHNNRNYVRTQNVNFLMRDEGNYKIGIYNYKSVASDPENDSNKTYGASALMNTNLNFNLITLSDPNKSLTLTTKLANDGDTYVYNFHNTSAYLSIGSQNMPVKEFGEFGLNINNQASITVKDSSLVITNSEIFAKNTSRYQTITGVYASTNYDYESNILIDNFRLNLNNSTIIANNSNDVSSIVGAYLQKANNIVAKDISTTISKDSDNGDRTIQINNIVNVATKNANSVQIQNSKLNIKNYNMRTDYIELESLYANNFISSKNGTLTIDNSSLDVDNIYAITASTSNLQSSVSIENTAIILKGENTAITNTRNGSNGLSSISLYRGSQQASIDNSENVSIKNASIVLDNTLAANALEKTVLYGIYSDYVSPAADMAKDTALIVRHRDDKEAFKVYDIASFGKILFYLRGDVENGDKIIKLQTNINNPDALNALKEIQVQFLAEPVNLNKGSKITLITNEQGSTFDPQLSNNSQKQVTFSKVYSYSYEKTPDKTTLNLVIDDIKENSTATEPTYTPTDTSTTITNDAADLASAMARTIDTSFKNVVEPSVSSIYQVGSNWHNLGKFSPTAKNSFATFANFSSSNLRLNSGSHIDLNGLNLIIGISKNIDELTYGGFVEGGYGKYKSYNSFNIANGVSADINGKGHIKYLGLGVLAKLNLMKNLYTEASLRFGQVSTDYTSNDFSKLPNSNIENPNYSTQRYYYGGHLGIGATFNLSQNSQGLDSSGSKELDIYLKAFYAHTSSDKIIISKTNVKLENVDSIRAKLGAKFNHYITDNFGYYVGLAIQKEFDSKAKAINLDYQNSNIKSPSLKGNTGIAELGLKYKFSQRLSTGFGVEGYIGKREGITGNLSVKWEF